MDVLNYNFVVIDNVLTFESRRVCPNFVQGLDFETPLIGVEMGPMKTYIP